VFAYERRAENETPVVAVVNLTPVPRREYRIGVPRAGFWREILNTDSEFYGGSNLGNAGGMTAEPVSAHGREQALSLLLPPLATLILKPG
jgi:1,4-alpha-glucan branching enzyme